jgi:tetratricopeptide (TPR) repeat protein
MRNIVLLFVGTVAAAAISVPSAMQCPEVADAHVTTGWREYRAGRLATAHAAFASARARCPNHTESQVGLAYVALRNQELDSARSLFVRVVERDPVHVDALVGLGLVQWRTAEYDTARRTFAKVLRLDPSRADVRQHVAALPAALGPPPVRPPLLLPDTLLYPARVNGERFEVRGAGGWQPFHVSGVNLGAALPGRFPSEFPDAHTYESWLIELAAMGANTVRVYTIHPPAFYDALAAHNLRNPQWPLWLLHGVWAELPPDDEYYDDAWQADFFAEMRRVVDVLHGRADVSRRAGHAAGYYTADVSRWTLGYILGREWEPYSVAAFNERYPHDTSWQGRFVGITGAAAMDVWLTKAMDHIVAYETDTYRAQRPVAYTNWPTLDPMTHDTELNTEDELTIRGIAFDRSSRNHNEDEVSLGAVPVLTTADFAAGYFAAYHAYPYYPDFFLQEPKYATGASSQGASTYFAYLLDLKQHVHGVPLVIAEYGVPASWGIAHLNPQGWHHGGHTEQQMAEINARLTREIAEAGLAGGVLFAWIDEWFKQNWLTAPFEQPAGRSRMWWNRLNAEQHYGVLAVEPERRLGRTLADRLAAWDTLAPLYPSASTAARAPDAAAAQGAAVKRGAAAARALSPDGLTLRAHADEAYLWLQVSGPDIASRRVLVGFDILDPARGQMRWPGADAPASPVGLELVLQLDTAGARLMAAPRANQYRLERLPQGATLRDFTTPVQNWPAGFFSGPFTQVVNAPFAPAVRDDGRFDPLWTVVNRGRVGADSTNYAGFGYDRGILPHGPLPDGAWEVTASGDVIEVRVPWNLINVTDPSSRHVLGGTGATQVETIGIVMAAQDAAGRWQTWPASGRRSDVAGFTWPTWDEPRFTVRRRPVFNEMRAVFRELNGNVEWVNP